MTWTLFFQLCALIILVGIVGGGWIDAHRKTELAKLDRELRWTKEADR